MLFDVICAILQISLSLLQLSFSPLNIRQPICILIGHTLRCITSGCCRC